MDEVEKVCSHVIIIRKGIKLYCGRVDEMTASKGLFELKVETNQTEFLTLLEKHPSISKIHLDHETYIASLSEEMSAAEMVVAFANDLGKDFAANVLGYEVR